MANANRGLGRGLGALLGDAALQTESADSLYLPISQVESCAGQPRKHFDDAALADLASIGQCLPAQGEAALVVAQMVDEYPQVR